MLCRKILTVQDISCVGQCSLTVALPVISACGVETCVLPSAVLSTHTAGFSGYTFRDLTSDMPAVSAHWKKENILFDALYTGYLGSVEQIDCVKAIIQANLKADGLVIVDPAMADNGTMYPGFDAVFANQMKELCAVADYVLPNITEACMLTGAEYRTEYDRAYVEDLLRHLTKLGAKNVVLTGVSYRPGKTGVVVFENGKYSYYEHEKMPKGSHGTGDIYASAFVGALVRGKSAFDAARIAADFTLLCIRQTQQEPDHWYGARFEPVLGSLIDMLK